jgi:ubiquinol-cytochrome c reductase cytochrome b subunit
MPDSPFAAPPNSSPPRPAASGLGDWLDQRTGWKHLLHEFLDERIPGGARWSYVFGSGLLFILLSQVVTGIFLALYYVPSADHAHTTVAYLVKVVTDGAFLRSLHAYGASIMVILLVIHMTQTFLFGSYKAGRELLWVAGCVLFALVLGMAFTGYLLPWDERSYFATAVGTNILSEVPLVGQWLKLLLRGGPDMGTLTVSRFFVAHVFLIPAALLLFVSLHLFLFRKAGPAGPPSGDAAELRRRAQTFYPRQLLMDAVMALLLIVILAALAHFRPVSLGPEANPADTQFIPRPDWYYRPVFQWLKYWEGPLSVVGILVIPGVLGGLLVLLPFYDRRAERRPGKRPVATGLFSVVLAGLLALGAISYYADYHDPAIAAQLRRQDEAERRFMEQPFEPESQAPAAAPAAEAANPLVEQGRQIFTAQGCVACHGEGGAGTALAVKLTGIGQKLPADELARLIRHPNARMTAGGMPPFPLADDQMKALIAYLDSLH